MKKITLFFSIESHKILSASWETVYASTSLLYADPKNCVEPDKANDSRRTPSTFHKQLKLMLYPQTCVPYVNAGKTYPHSKKLVCATDQAWVMEVNNGLFGQYISMTDLTPDKRFHVSIIEKEMALAQEMLVMQITNPERGQVSY